MRDGSREIAAGTVAAQQDRAIIGRDRPFIGGERVVEGGGVLVLGCEPIVDGHGLEAGALADLGADIVMALEAAENEAAAMVVDDDRRAIGLLVAIDADRNVVAGARDRGGLGADAVGIAGEELAAHPVVDVALLVDRVVDRIGRIEGVRALDEGPGLGVDQLGIVGHYLPFHTGSRFSAKARKPS